jgi:hypothetical protein
MAGKKSSTAHGSALQKNGAPKGAPVVATNLSLKQLEELVLAILPEPPDFVLENHGSIVFLRPLTPAAEEWVNGKIGRESGYQPQWPTVLLEARYVAPILEGLAEDGLSVSA